MVEISNVAAVRVLAMLAKWKEVMWLQILGNLLRALATVLLVWPEHQREAVGGQQVSCLRERGGLHWYEASVGVGRVFCGRVLGGICWHC